VEKYIIPNSIKLFLFFQLPQSSLNDFTGELAQKHALGVDSLFFLCVCVCGVGGGVFAIIIFPPLWNSWNMMKMTRIANKGRYCEFSNHDISITCLV